MCHARFQEFIIGRGEPKFGAQEINGNTPLSAKNVSF